MQDGAPCNRKVQTLYSEKSDKASALLWVTIKADRFAFGAHIEWDRC